MLASETPLHELASQQLLSRALVVVPLMLLPHSAGKRSTPPRGHIS